MLMRENLGFMVLRDRSEAQKDFNKVSKRTARIGKSAAAIVLSTGALIGFTPSQKEDAVGFGVISAVGIGAYIERRKAKSKIKKITNDYAVGQQTLNTLKHEDNPNFRPIQIAPLRMQAYHSNKPSEQFMQYAGFTFAGLSGAALDYSQGVTSQNSSIAMLGLTALAVGSAFLIHDNHPQRSKTFNEYCDLVDETITMQDKLAQYPTTTAKSTIAL